MRGVKPPHLLKGRLTLKKTLFVSTCLLALVAVNASAAPRQQDERWPRWYVGLSGNLAYMDDADVDPGRELELDSGWGISGSIGYLPPLAAPFDRLRFELEIAYRENDTDSLKVGGTTLSSDGDYSSTSYMANAYYDVATASRWTPYVGAGVGFSSVKLDSRSASLVVDDRDHVFAYQGMLGVAYSPETMPMVDWLLGYRYFATEDPKFTGSTGGIESEYSTHNLEFGAHFRF